MAPASHSLPVITASLIERMEAARRTWVDDPEAARQGLHRIAEEGVERVIDEATELFGAPAGEHLLRREVLEIFLPRYTRLALDQNELEQRGYDAWRRGDPIARLGGTVVALALAVLLSRLLHHPATLSFFALALVVPFIPEIRAGYHRRRYRRELEALLDDMVAIQDDLDRFPVTDVLARRLESSPASASAQTPPTAASTADADPDPDGDRPPPRQPDPVRH